ncbi:hypothetical protein JHK84_047252 [Glycine max]|nr:hypothetical protein JHK85_047819 [Glycine max]KAG5102283.1 hypothetical protein JHK84_047252 [Glycine max]
MLPPIAFDINGIKDKLSNQFRPWQRSFQFWVRAIDIYTGYKVFQVRVNFVKDAQKQEAMWERQHELAADKIFSMCYDLGGFFLKIAQIIGKPDLAPAAWVKRLVTLCDRAPPTPFDVVKLVLENELGQGINDVFDRFDVEPLGSASIAQVHRARLKGDTGDVVVKVNEPNKPNGFEMPVQHPGIQDLMMTDIHNLQAFALYMQKTDIKFDLYSVTKEMEKQIGYEFDFTREANAMQRIRKFLYENNKKSPVLVPRVALLDYGQVKDLPDQLRLAYANLVLAIANGDPLRAAESYRELGIETFTKCENELQELFKLAQTMFDTKLPPGVVMLQPFSEESSIKKIAVQSFPEELFSVLRTVHLLRGLSVGLGINYSCAEQWRPFAEEALSRAGRLKGGTVTLA